MRATTLFALTAALLIGLGLAVAAKMGGYFDRKQPAAEVKKPEIQVLVAGRNLYANDLIDVSGVRVRALRDDEKKDFEANAKNYLPPVQTAVYLRIAAKNIEADAPILRDSLKEMAKPAPLPERLIP